MDWKEQKESILRFKSELHEKGEVKKYFNFLLLFWLKDANTKEYQILSNTLVTGTFFLDLQAYIQDNHEEEETMICLLLLLVISRSHSATNLMFQVLGAKEVGNILRYFLLYSRLPKDIYQATIYSIFSFILTAPDAAKKALDINLIDHIIFILDDLFAYPITPKKIDAYLVHVILFVDCFLWLLAQPKEEFQCFRQQLFDHHMLKLYSYLGVFSKLFLKLTATVHSKMTFEQQLAFLSLECQFKECPKVSLLFGSSLESLILPLDTDVDNQTMHAYGSISQTVTAWFRLFYGATFSTHLQGLVTLHRQLISEITLNAFKAFIRSVFFRFWMPIQTLQLPLLFTLVSSLRIGPLVIKLLQCSKEGSQFVNLITSIIPRKFNFSQLRNEDLLQTCCRAFYLIMKNATHRGTNQCCFDGCSKQSPQLLQEKETNYRLSEGYKIEDIEKDKVIVNPCKVKVLQLCSQCHLFRYCSLECQKADWERHKHECKATQKVLQR